MFSMRYQTDLSDKEWEAIEHFFQYGKYGNRSIHSKRELVNAVRYLVKTGCQWRMLPNDFPPWPTVHSFYWRCKKNKTWERINQELVRLSRVKSERKPEPSYSIIDSQSAKTTSVSEERGIDGGKKIKGRKRHIVVDMEGNLPNVNQSARGEHARHSRRRRGVLGNGRQIAGNTGCMRGRGLSRDIRGFRCGHIRKNSGNSLKGLVKMGSAA